MSPRLRLALWYIANVGALGTRPYFSVVLADKGIADPDIAVFLALFPAAALFAAPVWSFAADRWGHVRALLTATTVGTTVGLGLVCGLSAPWALGLATALYAVCYAPQVPMVDAMTLAALPAGSQGYGRIRLWGSVAFLIVAFVGGWMREWWSLAPLVLGTALLATTIGASRILPYAPTSVARPDLRALLGLLTRPTTLALGLAAVAHGLGLSFYNGFIGRHIETLGLPSHLIGLVAVVGVGVEVAVMAASPWLLARVRPSRLLWLAIAITVPRWLGTAWSDDAVPLVPFQLLHGLSFGLFWVAAVPAFARHAPPAIARSAQSMLTATAFGIGPLLSLPLARWVLQSGTPADLYVVGAIASGVGAVVLLPVVLRTGPGAVE